MRGHLKMGKISGGFWPFLAGKRAVSVSEHLETLNLTKDWNMIGTAKKGENQ